MLVFLCKGLVLDVFRNISLMVFFEGSLDILILMLFFLNDMFCLVLFGLFFGVLLFLSIWFCFFKLLIILFFKYVCWVKNILLVLNDGLELLLLVKGCKYVCLFLVWFLYIGLWIFFLNLYVLI